MPSLFYPVFRDTCPHPRPVRPCPPLSALACLTPSARGRDIFQAMTPETPFNLVPLAKRLKVIPSDRVEVLMTIFTCAESYGVLYNKWCIR